MWKAYKLLFILLLCSCRQEETPLPVPYMSPREPEIIGITYEEMNCSAPFAVRFKAQVANLIGGESYSWTIDGFTYSSVEPLISVDTGTHELLLVVTNAIGTDSFTYQVRYNSTVIPVIADFTIYASGNNFRIPARVYFTNNSVRAGSYLWDFGDGYLSNLENPDHVYTNPGNYVVKLKAMCDADTAEKTMFITIKKEPAVIRFVGFEIVSFPKNYFPENDDDNSYGGDFYVKLYANTFLEGSSNVLYNKSKAPLYIEVPQQWNGDYRLWFSNNTNYIVELWDKNDKTDVGLISASFDTKDIRDYNYPEYFDYKLDNLLFRVHLEYED